VDAEDIEVVGEAMSTAAVLSKVSRLRPDVVLLDIGMPGEDGMSCLRTLRASHPKIKVIILSGTDDTRVRGTALSLGASAFVSKLVDPRDLAGIVHQVTEETVVSLPPDLRLSPEGPLALLTPTDRDVLKGLACEGGTANRDIGRRLGMSEYAVKYHLSRIYKKLGVSGRVEAARIAYSMDAGELERGES
jgi:DNA-binding NarL/FixJ family response regulator